MYNTGYFNNNNRYNPYYAPYVPYQQSVMQQQPMQQQIVQPVQYEIPISGIRFLNEKEMASYVLPLPNTKEMLIDKAGKVVCIKSTDQIGQSNAKYYKFEELVEDKQETQNKGNSEPKKAIPEYASKDDLKSLTSLIATMTDKIENLEGKINGKPTTDKPQQ